MGYTHYYTQKEDLTNEQWGAFGNTVRQIVKEYEGKVELEVSTSAITIHDAYWESFYVTKTLTTDPAMPKELAGFGFTKTGRADYDKVITACLIALYDIAPNAFVIGSDGTWPQWIDGRILYLKATGKEAVCPFSKVEV